MAAILPAGLRNGAKALLTDQAGLVQRMHPSFFRTGQSVFSRDRSNFKPSKIDRYVLGRILNMAQEKDESDKAQDNSVDDSFKNEAPTDIVKGLDANRYATKKTVAQGMLDIALLTSNASQLKYVLQVGPKHEFYTLLVVLISISIVLQVAMGFVLLSLNLLRDCMFHKPRHKNSALNINYATTATAFVVTVLNIMVSAFDSSLASYLQLPGE